MPLDWHHRLLLCPVILLFIPRPLYSLNIPTTDMPKIGAQKPVLAPSLLKPPQHTHPCPHPTFLALTPGSSTYRVHKVQGEDLDAADNSRQGTDYGSANGEPTDAKEQVLGKERERKNMTGAWGSVNLTYSGPGRIPGRGCKGENQDRRGWKGKEWWGCALTLRAPRASSQVELGATFSSCPDSGQGRRRGTVGQHTQTFPS